MLYAVGYQGQFASRREEVAHQRALSEQLLRWALQEEFGLDLSQLERAKSPSGKPYFPQCPVHFNVSHTRGLVCCGLSMAPLGVDAEAPRPYKEGLARRVCTQEELNWLALQQDRQAAFLSLWTLKESVLKLSGRGLGYGLRNAAFTFRQGEPCFVDPQVRLSQFPGGEGRVISAASRTERFTGVHWVEFA